MPGNDNIPFDYMGAKQAGYSDQEIQGFLKDKYDFQFDITGAKHSGYSDKEIGDYITNYKAQPSTPQPATSAETPDASSYPGFGSRAFEIPGLTKQDQMQRANDAIPNINKAFNSKETTKALNQMQQDEFQKTLNQTNLHSTSEVQPVPRPDIKLLPSVASENSEAFKDVTNPNSLAGRQTLKSVLNTTKDENFKNNLGADLAALDHQDKDPVIAGSLYNKIKSGKYGYDPVLQRPTVKMNPAEALIDGIETTYQAKKKADWLADHSPEEIAAQAEKEREQAKNDYYTPIPESKGWNIPFTNISTSSVAHTIGENANAFAKAGAASAAAVGTLGIAGIAAAPEFYAADAATPLLKPTLGALFIAHDAGKQAAGQTFDQVYNEQRDKGFDPQTATQEALHQAQFAGATTAGQMGLMSLAGLKIGEYPLPGTVWDKGLKQIIKSHAENIAPFLKRLVPEASVQGVIAGATKGLQNLDAGKPVLDGTGESAMGAATFVSLLSAVGGGLHALTPRGELVALNGISKMNPDLVEKGINQSVDQKSLTEQQAQELRDKLAEQRSLNKGLPSDVPLENRDKIQTLITKRNALENQLDPDHPSFVDKAYHPDIKEEISGVKKVKADGTSEGKDGINEKIRQLSAGESPNFHEDEKLTKTPLDQAKDLINKKAVNGFIGHYDATDPQELLKKIAEQAHGGTMLDGRFISTRPGTEEMFGKELTDIATKLHPEHIISESKAEDVTPGKGESIIPNSDKIHPVKDLQTWDLGDMAGKPEDEAAKKHLEGVVRDWDVKPAGKDGEAFGTEFLPRVIPHFDQILKEEPNNTTVITHSSVLKAYKVWDAMGRPDISKLTPEQKTEFSNEYNKEETHNADLETFKGTNGDIHVIRHGQTQDNAKNNFRSGDTNLTEKGIKQAEEVGQQLKEKTGGDVPKIITSDLPRAVHTSNLINDELGNKIKNQDNAIQQQTTNEVGVRNETAVRSGVGGQDNESQEPSGQGGRSGSGQPPTEETGKAEEKENARVSGIAERIQRQLGLKPYEKGKGWSKEDSLNFGQAALDHGIDPEKIVTNPKYSDLDFDERMAVVQAHNHNLTKAMYDAGDTYGENSKQYEEAVNALIYFQKKAAPMRAIWSRAGMSQQGEIDIDTGSFTSVKRAFEDITKTKATPKQEEVIKKLTTRVKESDQKINDLTNQIKDLWDKQGKQGKATVSYKDKSKAYADAFRKLKTKPFTFKDENGKDIDVHTAGISWNDIVETGAKAIEKTGEIADGIAEVVKSIKDADWYKGLSDNDKKKFEKQLTAHYSEEAPKIVLSPEEKNILRLERKLEDVKQGIVKQFESKREPSAKEKELNDEIFEAKKKLGLVPSKPLPNKPPETLSPAEKSIVAKEKQLEDLRNGIVKQSMEKREITPEEKKLNEQIFEEKKKLGLISSKPLQPKPEPTLSPEEKHIKQMEKQLEDIQNGIVKDIKEKRDQTPREKELSDKIFDAKKKLGLIPSKPLQAKPEATLTPEEKSIRRMEKELDDLRQGIVKQRLDKREPTEAEKDLKEQIADAKNKLGLQPSKQEVERPEDIEKQKDELAAKMVNQKGNVFTPEDAKSVWDYAKEKYIDKGVTDFDVMSRNVADDLGLTQDQVVHAIATPKTVKPISDGLWREMYNRRLAEQNAKAWVQSAGDNKAWKLFSKLYQFPSAIATALHATVLPFTHVGTDAWRPTNILNFLKLEMDTWKFAYGNKANYEQGMRTIMNDPNYRMWVEAKANIDPSTMTTDDYQLWASLLNKMGESGVRAFNAIKAYRLKQMNDMWAKTKPQWKFNADGTINKDVAKAIANHINLSTGTTGISFGDAGNVLTSVFFAPKLVTSQIQRIITEPAKALVNTGMWMFGKATPAENIQKNMVWRYMGEMAATYSGLLYANSAILSLTGSKQKINFTDPTKEDWLKFKGHGWELDGTGGLLSMTRFFGTMAYHGYQATLASKINKKEGKPGDKELTKVGSQLRNKLSPPAQLVSEGLFTGTDVMGRPVPWSNVPLTASQKEEGITKHTWGTYLGTKLPIFMAEGFKTAEESAKSSGMPESKAQTILKSFLVGAEAGTIGARINPDYELTKKPKSKPGDRF